MNSGRHVFVSGRVQGVGFRWTAIDQAKSLGLAGWVRNLPDGRVEAWIEGAPDAVDAMLAWLETGPQLAEVSGLEVQRVEPEQLDDFIARYDG